MREIGTVRVGQVVYTIHEATQRERAALRDAVGACNVHTGKILIRKGLAEGVRYETLVHEIGHAVAYGSGAREYLKTVLAEPDKVDEVEEMLLQILVPAMLSVHAEVKESK